MQIFAYDTFMTNSFPFPLSLAVWGHVIGGSLALLTFLIPLLSKKGGKVHAYSGWAYSAGMIIVAISAFLITPWRFFFDENGTNDTRNFAIFLFFIAVFSLASLQQGLYVFRFKKRIAKTMTFGSLGLPAILMFISLLILVKGSISQNWLFVIFGILAGATAAKHLRFWLTQQSHPKDWWFFHLENMFTCCIATVTAFMVTAVPRLYPSIRFDSIWVWLAPTFVLVPWMIWFKIKYQKQFGMKFRA